MRHKHLKSLSVVVLVGTLHDFQMRLLCFLHQNQLRSPINTSTINSLAIYNNVQFTITSTYMSLQ